LNRRYRLTTVGVYTYRKLLPTFIYVDAVVVDTPVVDAAAEEAIANCREVDDRLERARTFVTYLDNQWSLVEAGAVPFDWAETSKMLRRDFERVERSARRQTRPRRPQRSTPQRGRRARRSPPDGP
jgi:hypothetical protein